MTIRVNYGIFFVVGSVAQQVEQRTHKPLVGGSIPPATTNSYLTFCNSTTQTVDSAKIIQPDSNFFIPVYWRVGIHNPYLPLSPRAKAENEALYNS